jgi:hypothetical protein
VLRLVKFIIFRKKTDSEIRRSVTLCKVQQLTFSPLLLPNQRIRLRCSFRRAPEALPYSAVGAVLKGENYWEMLPELAERSSAVEFTRSKW